MRQSRQFLDSPNSSQKTKIQSRSRRPRLMSPPSPSPAHLNQAMGRPPLHPLAQHWHRCPPLAAKSPHLPPHNQLSVSPPPISQRSSWRRQRPHQPRRRQHHPNRRQRRRVRPVLKKRSSFLAETRFQPDLRFNLQHLTLVLLRLNSLHHHNHPLIQDQDGPALRLQRPLPRPILHPVLQTLPTVEEPQRLAQERIIYRLTTR
jgi:hypothetical protein